MPIWFGIFLIHLVIGLSTMCLFGYIYVDCMKPSIMSYKPWLILKVCWLKAPSPQQGLVCWPSMAGDKVCFWYGWAKKTRSVWHSRIPPPPPSVQVIPVAPLKQAGTVLGSRWMIAFSQENHMNSIIWKNLKPDSIQHATWGRYFDILMFIIQIH